MEMAQPLEQSPHLHGASRRSRLVLRVGERFVETRQVSQLVGLRLDESTVDAPQDIQRLAVSRVRDLQIPWSPGTVEARRAGRNRDSGSCSIHR